MADVLGHSGILLTKKASVTACMAILTSHVVTGEGNYLYPLKACDCVFVGGFCLTNVVVRRVSSTQASRTGHTVDPRRLDGGDDVPGGINCSELCRFAPPMCWGLVVVSWSIHASSTMRKALGSSPGQPRARRIPRRIEEHDCLSSPTEITDLDLDLMEQLHVTVTLTQQYAAARTARAPFGPR